MNIRRIIDKMSPTQVIVSYYFLMATISTILFSLPIALQDGVHLAFIDAVFLAVSAVSVTGLSVVDITETFSTTGYFIMLFVLQFGGIGVMTLSTVVWIIFKRRIGFKERRLIMAVLVAVFSVCIGGIIAGDLHVGERYDQCRV